MVDFALHSSGTRPGSQVHKKNLEGFMDQLLLLGSSVSSLKALPTVILPT